MNRLHKLCYKYDINLEIAYGNGEDHWYMDAYEFGTDQSWHVKKVRDFNDLCGYMCDEIIQSIKEGKLK